MSLIAGFRQIVLALLAVVPLAAGVGILRGRVWAAYGFALFEAAQLAAIPFVLWRGANVVRAQITASGILLGAVALFFFLTGKSLERSGAARGYASPWIALACVFTLPLIFVQAFVIPSGGMEDTLLKGDRLLVRVFPRVTPRQGEIVVFRYPPDRHQTYVKRVIGMPGDRVRIVSRVVYRNGAALNEPYVSHSLAYNRYRDDFPGDPAARAEASPEQGMTGATDMLSNHVSGGDVLVPAGKYFVLGDNRDNSLDSRYWGFLDEADVLGRPLFIYDSEAMVANGTRRQVRWDRILKIL